MTKLEVLQESINKLEHKAPHQLTNTSRKIETVKDTISAAKDVTDKLKQRKIAFYQQHQNSDRVAIHTQWMQSTPPIIPASFLPKFIPNEPEREYQIRKTQKKKDLDAWLQILSYRAEKANEEVNNIDGTVRQEIQDSRLSEEEKGKQNEAWKKAVRVEEIKSEEIWDKKRAEILKLPEIQIKNQRIQIRDGRTYATVAKTNFTNPARNPAREDEGWEEVTYRNRRTDQQRQTQGANSRRPTDFIRRGPPHRRKIRNQYDRR